MFAFPSETSEIIITPKLGVRKIGGIPLGKDAALGGRLLEGERGVVSYVTRSELRNAVSTGNLRGVPRALDGVDVLTQRPSLDSIINIRGSLLKETGRFGDGIIGAQSVEFGMPLVTNDVELAAAVRALGGTVR
jgi:predicted nucleic acid-binding protein